MTAVTPPILIPEALADLAPLSLDQMMKGLVHKLLDWLLMDGEAEITADIITSGKKSVFTKKYVI